MDSSSNSVSSCSFVVSSSLISFTGSIFTQASASSFGTIISTGSALRTTDGAMSVLIISCFSSFTSFSFTQGRLGFSASAMLYAASSVASSCSVSAGSFFISSIGCVDCIGGVSCIG
ncbi:hypothetical protein PUN28_014663 [Cardiocondyla obscurior]|uniref:Secreted protein n=1 Tax=Cardiocondyla obscurior TaxID=286306 RepID=A0AAW2EXX6_9HYME